MFIEKSDKDWLAKGWTQNVVNWSWQRGLWNGKKEWGCAKRRSRGRGKASVGEWRSGGGRVGAGGGGGSGGGELEGSQGRLKQPGCQDSDACLSFRASVTLFPGLLRRWSICAKEYIYVHIGPKNTVFPTRSHSQREKKNPDSSSIFTRFHEWIAAMLLLHFLYSWLRPLGLLPMTTAAGCLCALQEGNDGISDDSLMIARDVKWPWS